jgi:4-carboxymuconolactone decarboxylase
MSEASKGGRLPPIPDDRQSAAQKKVVKAMLAGSRKAVRGPFIALLRSPDLCDRAQKLGEYLRFRSRLPPKLRELAILATARHWQQTYEWDAHARIAQEAGLSEQSMDTLALEWDGAGLPPEEQTVLRFCRELHRHRTVSDATYRAAAILLGEDGVVDLCGICGYYTLLAMVMNVAQTPLPEGAAPVPFSAPEAKTAQ